MRKWRLHVVGLGAIISIVVIMFWASGALNSAQNAAPTVGGTKRFTGERFIQISSASWGLNCNRTIERHNQSVDEAERNFAKDAPKRIDEVNKDNALLALSRMCDGRTLCKISKVKTSTIGLEPIGLRCNKELEVSYRCFEFDRAQELTVKQNKPLEIDCRKPKDEAR